MVVPSFASSVSCVAWFTLNGFDNWIKPYDKTKRKKLNASQSAARQIKLKHAVQENNQIMAETQCHMARVHCS